MRLSRRALLRLVAAASLAAGSRAAGAADGSAARLAGHPLARRLRSPDTAYDLGADYLQRHPAEAAPAALRRLLGLGDGPLLGRSAEELAAFLTDFAHRHREDFRAGKVETVHGWILTRSELRLFALLHVETA